MAAVSAETTDTTRAPSPTTNGLTEKKSNGSTVVHPNGHDAAAKVADIAGEKPLMTDEEIRLAQMPTGLRLYLIMLGLMLAVYVVSLDQTIVAPAIPVISNQFNALQDVGWYASAYFATSTALQPLYGRLYRLNLKWPFVSCIIIFEVGSIICAAAQSSTTFIVGRAIAGVGLAGGYIGVLTIIAASVPLNKVPVWSGLVGAVYGIGAITGPLIGGVFTTEVTWRWCFWLSLPLGGVTLATVVLFFHPPKRENNHGGIVKILIGLDLLGTAIALGAMICILLAMQDGGLSHAWSSGRSIGLLVAFGVLVILFVINEWFMKDNAIIPLRILCTRTIGFASLSNFGIGASYFSVAIFLPIYFQLLGSSSIRSGVQMLPLVCGVIFSVTISGGTAPVIGYVQPFLFGGTILATIGSGLFQLFDAQTSQPYWIGVTFLYGIGMGAAFQMPFVISQTFSSGLETEIGSSITIFFQTLGGAIIVAVSQSVYANIFKQQVMRLTLVGVDQMQIISAGATGFREFVPADELGLVVDAAMVAIRKAFIPACVFIGLSLVAALPLPFASIKGKTAAGGA